MTTIDFPGATDTDLSGINDSGQIVGSYIVDGSGVGSKGFLFSGGQFTLIVFPGAQFTIPVAINNAGEVVGYYFAGGVGFQGFLWNGGSFVPVPPPVGSGPFFFNGINNAGQIVGNTSSSGFLFAAGSYSFINKGNFTIASGINDAGVITGSFQDNNNVTHAFVLSGGPGGKLVTLDSLGLVQPSPSAINNAGTIVGSYQRPGGGQLGFIASTISLLDPVDVDPSNSLLNGSAVTTDAGLLAAKGRPVQGVAADGVAQAVIRIPATNVGDQFTLTLVNDQNGQIIPDEDGALGNPGDAIFAQGQITVTAVNTGTGPNGPNPPFAFAVYRAPVDFARPTGATTYKSGTCGGVSKSDDQLACRSVSIQVQGPSGNATTVPVTIVRPPVIMIHGLWDNWSTWNNFSPLITGPGTVDTRFSVGRVSYDAAIGTTIIGSDPFYSTKQLNRIQANSMGFQYNARSVLAQIEQWIGTGNFKGGRNPANIPVAAVQADIVAHSMGGDITRTLVLEPTFLNDSTFGQGNIHKIITIDTPHLGSPLAISLLSPPENGGCLQDLLANRGKFTLSSVVFSDGSLFSGAIADLQGDDTTGALSAALSKFNSSAPHLLPTSLIAGVYQNFAALDSDANAIAIRNWGFGCPSDPLAQQLTSSGWPPIFHSNPNDAIVSENSQLNGLIPSPGSQFFGYVHSPGTEKLGFAGPSVIDAGPIPNQVIFLLNTPASDSVYYNLLNP